MSEVLEVVSVDRGRTHSEAAYLWDAEGNLSSLGKRVGKRRLIEMGVILGQVEQFFTVMIWM